MAQAPVAEPSSQQIIDALKPAKTRGMRNLGVKEAEPEAPSVNAPASQAAPAPSSAPAAQVASTVPVKPASIDLAIQFEFGSSQVSASSRKTLDALSAALAAPELATLRFRIEGHTDSKGRAAYNRKLSEERANEVKRILVSRKIAGSRLVAEGKGSSQPLNEADPAASENRRVRIVGLERK
jgi:outer membrane protein OmpA-like peptidoglycan-associated protein